MAVSPGRACPHPPGARAGSRAGSQPHLAERGPLVLALGVEVLAGVRVGEEHGDRAELVEQPQADARGVPEAHGAVLVPVGGAVSGRPGRARAAPAPHALLCGRRAAPATYPVSSRSLWGGVGARLVPPSTGHSWGRRRRRRSARGSLAPGGRWAARGGAYHGGEVRVLPAARGDDPLPQLEGDVGDVVGAGDGGAVQRGQVGRLHGRPARRPQVQHHQLLLGQHQQRIGVVEGWGTGQGQGRPEPAGSRSPSPARPGGI